MTEFDLSHLIIVAVGMLLAGGIIGLAIGRSTSPQSKATETLKEELEQLKEEQRDYQHEVAEHFAETADLVNNMNQSYKAVHEHLANSALKLSNPDISRQILEAGTSQPALESQAMGELQEQPKDWAPKNPGDKGTLSEDFGLEKHGTAEPEESEAKEEEKA
ncbi:YhcB family protein [Pseudoteredinibacter isoporae]|uniref:YhcB family protein n=1 Tax=Pseudoteredinibacter isoporae TaxID=570281 RepID=UPI003102E671